MKRHSLFDLMRFWAVVTGLVLAAVYFGALRFGIATPQALPLLIAAVGGFEMFLFVQDVVLARGRPQP